MSIREGSAGNGERQPPVLNSRLATAPDAGRLLTYDNWPIRFAMIGSVRQPGLVPDLVPERERQRMAAPKWRLWTTEPRGDS